jgi:hypothetical protein
MRRHRRLLSLVVPALGLMLACASQGRAAQLLRGGYMADSSAATGGDEGTDALSSSSFGLSDNDPGFMIDFTPRGGGSVLLDDLGLSGTDMPRLRLSFSGSAAEPDHLGLLSGGRELGVQPGAPTSAAAGGTLALGGALEWSGFSLGGAVSRTSLMGTETDMMGATFGYGALSARLSFGEQPRVDAPNRDFWLFSTDLFALPWLSLEGDLAVQSTPDADPSTMGRLGVRLRF